MRKFFVLFLLLGTTISGYCHTVVGIHGFMATYRSMNHVRKALVPCGFNVCLWSYESRGQTVCCSALQLVEYLKQLACGEQGEPIDFVTHSIGALVLRAALNLPDCPEEAKRGRIVMIAPPNQGSALGRHFYPVSPIRMIMGNKSGRELMTYTPCDMACFGNLPECSEVLVLAGSCGVHPFFNGCQNDGFLYVDETFLNTPNYTFRVLPLSHGRLLTNRTSLSIVRDFLLCGNVP